MFKCFTLKGEFSKCMWEGGKNNGKEGGGLINLMTRFINIKFIIISKIYGMYSNSEINL
jgi:hypothetical protein